jgi:AcrR family transcriptional regulator
MPPSTTFSKKAIIEAALQVVRQQGLGGLSARKVADELGSSTAPVYHVFKSMDALILSVLKSIKAMALEQMHVAYTDRHFLNIGMGFAIFAREEPGLFRAFHLENRAHRQFVDELFVELRDSMRKDPRFADMPDDDRAALLAKMWTFTLGLSMQICCDGVPDPSDEWIRNTLVETGTIVIADALGRLKDGDG